LVNNLEDQPRFSRIPRELRYYGITNRNPAGYDVERLGGNYYMSDIQAAVALSFLEPRNRIPEFIQERVVVASLYHEMLEDRGLKKLIKPTRFMPEGDAYHLFPVILDRKENCVALQYSLSEALIETGTHYIPLHKFSLYAHALRGPTSYLDSIADSILTLPCHHGMTEEDVVRVVDELEKFVKHS
jgi:dTDP-4-amino-4,6-dideoxygalactose transaminase